MIGILTAARARTFVKEQKNREQVLEEKRAKRGAKKICQIIRSASKEGRTGCKIDSKKIRYSTLAVAYLRDKLGYNVHLDATSKIISVDWE